ncbi:MAG: hypothetical protein P1V36_11200 [Planctomycetota bacterium]|nr:hypothetical protein [Planctomycetota bacterium]
MIGRRLRRAGLAGFLLWTLGLHAGSAAAEDPFAAERRARTQIVRLLEPLADQAADKGDVTGAQAISETCLWVSGVPHPNEDALRAAIPRGVAGETDHTAWITEQWARLTPHVKVLAASSRDWDVLDARLVAQLPLVLPHVRRLNAARIRLGLRAMRYDAKRSVEDIRLAREAVRSKTLEDKLRRGNRTVIPVEPGLATRLFLNDPALRVGLFDPGDKGLTIGTWPREVAPPDPRRHGEPSWRHRLFATCLGWSGNRDGLVRGPARLGVHPSPAVALHRWETLMQGQDLLGSPVPKRVSLHGFGAMPGVGATIEVSVGGTPVAGTCERFGADGNWALVFRFKTEVLPETAYRFRAYAKDGRELHRWTVRTTSGEG